METLLRYKGAFPLGGTASGTAAVFSPITAAQIARLYFPFYRLHLAATGAGRFSGAAVPAAARSGRAGANSLNFAILIAIPAILTALSHLLLNILAHQGDSQ